MLQAETSVEEGRNIHSESTSDTEVENGVAESNATYTTVSRILSHTNIESVNESVIERPVDENQNTIQGVLMTPDGSILPLKTISRSNSFIIEPVVTNEVERDKSSVQVNDSSTSLDTVRMQRSRRATQNSRAYERSAVERIPENNDETICFQAQTEGN
jgi:hypothetical protein